MENQITISEKISSLEEKIKSELLSIYPDLQVNVYLKNQVLNDVNYKYCGERAYAGMQEGCVRVYWDKFFDRICGNGWMFGRDWIFKFDAKDGSCKYDGYPNDVFEAVNIFIQDMKTNKLI